MISVIIATANDEPELVHTLAMLVPAAMSGVVKDVIVTDRHSEDATVQAADAAGCTVIESDAALPTRLTAAAAMARASWLLFLRPGVVLEPAWAGEASRFVQDAEAGRAGGSAAVFSRVPRPRLVGSRFSELAAALRAAFTSRRLTPNQGLLIAKTAYERLGGHRGASDPEGDLIARIGPRRIVMLRSMAEVADGLRVKSAP